ncbi:hypothetical protein quinque_011495 [Culex quinquefasciatus]
MMRYNKDGAHDPILRHFYDKRIGVKVGADHLGDDWKLDVFKITDGNDKQSVLTNPRVRLLLKKGHFCCRPRCAFRYDLCGEAPTARDGRQEDQVEGAQDPASHRAGGAGAQETSSRRQEASRKEVLALCRRQQHICRRSRLSSIRDSRRLKVTEAAKKRDEVNTAKKSEEDDKKTDTSEVLSRP